MKEIFWITLLNLVIQNSIEGISTLDFEHVLFVTNQQDRKQKALYKLQSYIGVSHFIGY